MELCSDGHDEICFESVAYNRGTRNKCPLCEMRADLEQQVQGSTADAAHFEKLLDQADAEAKELKARIAELEEQLKETV